MSNYKLPKLIKPEPLKEKQIYLLASGNMREARNRDTWSDQNALEQTLVKVFAEEGYDLIRAFPFHPVLGHGHITGQRHGMDIFKQIHPEAPLVIAISAWQCSSHILPGLRDHKGPILTISNWSGKWPGLVGLLNLNGSLTKMGTPYSTLWSKDFDDSFFISQLRNWLYSGIINNDESHVKNWCPDSTSEEIHLGEALAKELLQNKAIMGVFDEGCLGMYNAIIEDELLNRIGIYKERLSQATLAAAMFEVTTKEAEEVRNWLEAKGFKFIVGSNPEEDLTDHQIQEQCKMYIAAMRMAAQYHCDAIGIQYQDGLKDLAPASDLAEGLLNNPNRPPVYDTHKGKELFAKDALPHFNEADEGAGIDMIINHRIWNAMKMDPSTTLHDVRWGEHYTGQNIDDFVWVFMISGAIPASHIDGGYAKAVSERQPPGAFPSGGGSLKGVGKPGEIVWSRVYIDKKDLHVDLGLATAVSLPEVEVNRRWQLTTPSWPILNAVLHGISRDQFMGRHKSNHITVTYAPTAAQANQALTVKAAMMHALGFKVHLCGV